MLKIEITGKTKPRLDFPKLMIFEEEGEKTIILAFKQESGNIWGTVIESTNEDEKIGYHSQRWNSDKFKDFVGTVTIKS